MRRDRGSLTIEFAGTVWIVALAAMVLWQMLLLGYVATSAESAARSGSRQASVTSTEDGEETAMEALAPWLREGAEAAVEEDGTFTEVSVPVPLLLPQFFFDVDGWKITRTAEFPGG